MSNLYSLKLLPLGEFPSQDMQKWKIKVRCFVIPVHVNPLHSGAIVAYSGVTLVSFHFIAVSFRLVPVYSGTILVHSVSFRRHSASFRYIPVYSGIFRSVPVFSNACDNATYVVTKKAWKFSYTARRFVDFVHGLMGNKKEVGGMFKLRENTASECQRMSNDRKQRKRLRSRKGRS